MKIYPLFAIAALFFSLVACESAPEEEEARNGEPGTGKPAPARPGQKGLKKAAGEPPAGSDPQDLYRILASPKVAFLPLKNRLKSLGNGDPPQKYQLDPLWRPLCICQIPVGVFPPGACGTGILVKKGIP